jgi:hypothetical protein
MALFQINPDEIFTPRSAEVNPRLYIPRPELESELIDALDETQHIIIFGESGNGKSWLYKRVFKQKNVRFQVVNLVNASRLGSLSAAFKDQIDRLEEVRKKEYELAKSAKISPGGLGAEFEGTWTYEVGKKEPYEDLLSYMSRFNGKKKVLVFDNFEQIASDEDLCKQVSDCIILLDDPNYAAYGVKICIVGVPSGIEEILARHGNIQTISSRMKEIPEVERMTKNEARALMELGLERILDLRIEFDRETFYESVLWITDRIALELHEFGLRLAKEARKNKDRIDQKVWDRAIKKWTDNSIRTFCASVSMRLNARETKAARRNQCIYACGKIEKSNFTYKDIESIIREEFSDSTSGISLNVSGELSALANGNNPILKRLPSDDAYRLASPKFRMAIRTMLRKDDSGKVTKVVSVG